MAFGFTSGTGPVGEIAGSQFMMTLAFSGGGSVDLEQKMPSGSWIKVETGITTTYSKAWDSPRPTVLRFNVTAHPAPIEWEIDAV